MRWRPTLIHVAALSALVTASSAPAQQGQVLDLKVHGASLEGNLLGDSPDRDVLVYLPASYEQEPDRRYPVLYLLHGYCPPCGSLYSWWFDSNSYPGHAGRILEQLLTDGRAVEMIMVAPDVANAYGGAWYANSVTIGNWTDFVARDLVQYVDANYRTLADRAHRGVAGHSMGGDGALYVAFENPDVFGAVYSMAPGPAGYTAESGLGAASWPAQWRTLLDAIEAGVTEFSKLPGEAQFHVTFGATAAPNPDNPPFFIDYLYEDVGGELRLVDSVWQRWHARDPAVLAHTLADRVRQLDAIYLDVGLLDALLPDARAVSRSLRDERIPHVFEEFLGDHTSDVARLMRGRVLPDFSRYFSGRQPKLLAGTDDLGSHRSGERLALHFELALAGPLPATGEYPDLVLDATPLGLGPVALTHDGNGRYTFVEPSLSPLTGNHVLPVRLPSEGPDAAPLFVARLQVVPAADLVVVEDSLAADWSVESAGGAEVPVATSDGPVFAGARALELRVASSSFSGWRLNLSPPQPIDPFGYTHLRFAFHPGTLAGRALNLNVGAAGVKLVDPRLGGLVNLELKEWQVVEVDLAALHVVEPFGRINFNGTVEGTFYVDDMRLVAAEIEAPAVTAVTERLADAAPRAFALEPSYPNPFNGTTVIPFALGRAGRVELAVYDLLGQRVVTLVRGERPAGAHSLRWDGRDEAGRGLASGAYLVRLQAGAETTTRKVLLLR